MITKGPNIGYWLPDYAGGLQGLDLGLGPAQDTVEHLEIVFSQVGGPTVDGPQGWTKTAKAVRPRVGSLFPRERQLERRPAPAGVRPTSGRWEPGDGKAGHAVGLQAFGDLPRGTGKRSIPPITGPVRRGGANAGSRPRNGFPPPNRGGPAPPPGPPTPCRWPPTS